MLKLSEQDVELNATCSTKDEALRLIASNMSTGGLVDPDYLIGMLQREQQTSTFLGNGIAIPHGTPETRNLIHHTGIKVVRFPNGLDWGDGQVVYTAIGIAAKSDEHLAILRQLTHVITSPELSSRLHNTSSATQVVEILSGATERHGLSIQPDNMRTGLQLGSSDEARALCAAILCNFEGINSDTLQSLLAEPTLPLSERVALVCTQDNERLPVLAAVQYRLNNQEPMLLLSLLTREDSHKTLLDHLLSLHRGGTLNNLADADDPLQLTQLLTETGVDGQSATCRLPMPHGLHARPATRLVQLVKSMGVEVFVENLDLGTEPVKATSIARLISLGVCFGHTLRFTVPNGPDAVEQLATLLREVAKGLGDDIAPIPGEDLVSPTLEDTPSSAPIKEVPKGQITPLKPGDVINGLCGAPGMAIGTVFVEQPPSFNYEEIATDTRAQVARLEQAVAIVKENMHDRIRQGSDANQAAIQIAEMHLALLDDPALIEDACTRIMQSKSAEWAWHTTYEQLAERQEKNTDLLLAERAADFRDIGLQVLAVLTGHKTESNETSPHILVCHELAASKVPMLDPAIVQAIVTVVGGVTSHAAILARTAGIPLLVGCGRQVLTLTNGDTLIVNCDAQLAVCPESYEEIDRARVEMECKQKQARLAYERRNEPAMTSDGLRIEVVANIANSGQVPQALEYGAEGVGLYRSEFVYMEYGREPSVEQQVAEYQQAFSHLEGRPLVVRTLDVGGDKPLPYLAMAAEENPFLGLRGARLSLQYPDMMERQIDALLQAATSDNLKIMFPMICDIAEWRQLRDMAMNIARNYSNTTFELGMMIEVPSAALLAHIFAPELDFFSIGTNDLTQYTMAIDRGHPTLSGMADPLHPSILKLIKMTIDAARGNNAWVGVCGELAGDPLGAVILTGLGASELSMSAKAIPLAKASIRGVSMPQAQALATAAINAESAQAVRSLKIEDF